MLFGQGAGFGSKKKYMFRKVTIQLKLVEGDSVGTGPFLSQCIELFSSADNQICINELNITSLGIIDIPICLGGSISSTGSTLYVLMIKIHVCWSWTLFPTITQGFPRENVKIIGERPLQGNRWNRMDQSYPIPDYCEPQALQGKFEIPILTLTMPKKTTSQVAPKQQELGTSQENGEAKPTENV
ncbi:hypothetical protein JHK82_042983 [Glycine max]|nr:hypothetical protein JHK86_043002 [Glycine max]KAG5106013.1 hypothetical protein JHK82_042983 [Glycine max]